MYKTKNISNTHRWQRRYNKNTGTNDVSTPEVAPRYKSNNAVTATDRIELQRTDIESFRNEEGLSDDTQEATRWRLGTLGTWLAKPGLLSISSILL
jgi:hypothetical protein